MDRIAEKRERLLRDLFPAGVPRLWCPLLTHYGKDGAIDFDRMSAHFHHIVPFVKGFLIPGSTGDGWELDDGETRQVTEFALGLARRDGISLLLGALKRDAAAMKKSVADMFGLLEPPAAAEADDRVQTLRDRRVCGFTVCPPEGKTLSQKEIEAGLAGLLEMGLPTALYQLPQVTGNEVSPKTFGRLIGMYPNLIFFKDSSGFDGIASSDTDKGGVFLVRGAEGDYARWLRETGGPYAGFLLSTANCFPQELKTLIENLERGEWEKARALSDRLTAAIRDVFSLVNPLPCGNAFTNANKSIDHFLAFGPSARATAGPLLHGRISIPADILAATGAILARCLLMPEKGYLE
jgi:dihydrodipicolinate synthase/N-acetylneuraminate lyase